MNSAEPQTKGRGTTGGNVPPVPKLHKYRESMSHAQLRKIEDQRLIRDRFLSFALTAVLHFGVLAGIVYANTKDEGGPPQEALPVVEVTLEDLAPEPVKPEEVEEQDPEENQNNDYDAAQLIASLPEPPSALSIDSPIQDKIRPTPPVMPRPDQLGTLAVPTRKITNSAAASGAKAALANVFDISQLDSNPRPRVQTAPIYPYELKQQGISGTARIRLTVDERGNVVECSVDSASHREFGEAALAAVRNWRFQIGRRGGKPVAFTMIAPLNFNIQDAK